MSQTSNSIEFRSQEATLRGRLYLPIEGQEPCPVVIMAHGFSSTMDGMTADKYAEQFQKAGFAALLYDHRNLGSSDGEPRSEINFFVQARGYIDCMDLVQTLPQLDPAKIAIWGCSSSAREVFMVGAIDDRAKVILAQVPALGSDLPKDDKDGDMFEAVKSLILMDRITDHPHTKTGNIPVVSPDQTKTPSAVQGVEAYNWFMEYGERPETNWHNKVSICRPEMPEQFHVGQCAGHLKAPIIMVAAIDDEIASADFGVTSAIFEMIDQPKELVEIEGGHFGLLRYPSPFFDRSSKTQVDFLKRHLTGVSA